MPPVTVTALPEELIAITILGDGSTSLGLQKAVRRLAELDPEMGDMFKRALWIRNRVVEILEERGDKVTERNIYRYASTNFYELADEASKVDVG